MKTNNNQPKKILVISQTTPVDSGSGAGMRIGMTIEALAKIGDVSLLIITQHNRSAANETPLKYRQLCQDRITTIEDTAAAPRNLQHELTQLAPRLLSTWRNEWLKSPALQVIQKDYDLVWVFRLKMTPVMQHLLSHDLIKRSAQILDLDDIESRTCYRRAMLLRKSLGMQCFLLELIESAKLRLSENQALKQFDALLVCSTDDQSDMARRRGKALVAVLPNGIRLSNPLPKVANQNSTPAVMLFVGSLDHDPNIEGLLWMCREVLPELKRLNSQPLKFIVVGKSPDPRIEKLGRDGLFELHANVPDVAPFYEASTICIAPIHAGGGTRIKILEAFAYGVPVVSTTVGAEGLETQHNVHLAIADSPQAFAQELLVLINDPDKRHKLTRNAHALLDANFSLDAICNRTKSIIENVLSAT